MAKAWLCLQKDPEDYVAVREGYADTLGVSYNWNELVHNSRGLAPGDFLAIWNPESGLRGVSVIERIDSSRESLRRTRCPECKATDVRPRKRKRPAYRCGITDCRAEFDEPVIDDFLGEVFVGYYDASWTPIEGVDAKGCRALARDPVSQHSIRPIDLGRLRDLLRDHLSPSSLDILESRSIPLPGGHRKAVVRLRLGQGAFRDRLIARYGLVCAFTGASHAAALQAAHLYRYADLGVHEEHGGLLMRADIHGLFDRGLISVDPKTLAIDLHLAIRELEAYAPLVSRPLQVTLTEKQRDWLRCHWEQWRVSR